MKNRILKAIFMIAISILFFGCSSDDSGTPECPVLTCENGGYFEDCQCNCPEGFTGTNCQTPITPSRVIITNVDVIVFPNQNGSSNWDIGSPADLSMSIQYGQTPLFISQQYYADDISTGENYFPFQVSPALSISNVNEIHSIMLWDYDGEDIPATEDDLMSSVAFYPYDASRGFPNKITASNLPSQTIIELTLQYEW